MPPDHAAGDDRPDAAGVDAAVDRGRSHRPGGADAPCEAGGRAVLSDSSRCCEFTRKHCTPSARGTSRPGTVPVPRCPPVDPRPAGETSARNVSVRRFLQIPPGALAATPPLRGARARRGPRHPDPPLPQARIAFSPGFRRGFDPPADAPQGPPPRPAGGAGYGPGAAGELRDRKG